MEIEANITYNKVEDYAEVLLQNETKSNCAKCRKHQSNARFIEAFQIQCRIDRPKNIIGCLISKGSERV